MIDQTKFSIEVEIFDFDLLNIVSTFSTLFFSLSFHMTTSSSHGIYTKSENTCMDGDEDDPDIRDEDLMNMYEVSIHYVFHCFSF